MSVSGLGRTSHPPFPLPRTPHRVITTRVLPLRAADRVCVCVRMHHCVVRCDCGYMTVLSPWPDVCHQHGRNGARGNDGRSASSSGQNGRDANGPRRGDDAPNSGMCCEAVWAALPCYLSVPRLTRVHSLAPLAAGVPTRGHGVDDGGHGTHGTNGTHATNAGNIE